MTQPYKICPNCQQPAQINAIGCARCGRPYRTTAPPQPTQVFAAPVSPQPIVGPPPKSYPFALGIGAGCLFAVALLCFGIWLAVSSLRPKGGPETQALAETMRLYVGAYPVSFQAKFGEPDHTSSSTAEGTKLFFWDYRCKDGTVTVTFNSETQKVQRIATE